MIAKLPKPLPLFHEIKTLIDSARQRAAVAVNAELIQQVGCGEVTNRIAPNGPGDDAVRFAHRHPTVKPDSGILQTLSTKLVLA
ncbi:MAG: hypothetical protein ACYDIB_01700 [Desulfobulbia bacterium]|nr:MAG: hypothetical protein CVU58_00410 [Deltaproteobacteria bacterium HGW-Deltaproteobacteria-16]